MAATRERAELPLQILSEGLDRAIAMGNQDQARYVYGRVTGALFLAYSLGLLSEAEHDERFDEARDRLYNAF